MQKIVFSFKFVLKLKNITQIRWWIFAIAYFQKKVYFTIQYFIAFVRFFSKKVLDNLL